MKTDCPWRLWVVLQDKGERRGQELFIRKVNDQHNHAIISAVVARHPKKRKLDEHSSEMAAGFLELQANKKLVQQAMQKKTGQFIALKDLSNLQQKGNKRILLLSGSLWITSRR
jgi:hypothetical protein